MGVLRGWAFSYERGTPTFQLGRVVLLRFGRGLGVWGVGCRYTATWKREFKIPWRKAGLLISMINWTRNSRLSIKISLSTVSLVARDADALERAVGVAAVGVLNMPLKGYIANTEDSKNLKVRVFDQRVWTHEVCDQTSQVQ